MVISPVGSGEENETASSFVKKLHNACGMAHALEMNGTVRSRPTDVSLCTRAATGDMQQIKFIKTVVSAGCK